MFENNNILLTLLTLLPIIVYIYIFTKYLPGVKIQFSKTIKFLLYGILSTLVVFITHFIFPNWTQNYFIENIFISLTFSAFIQVALLEEFAKFLLLRFCQLHERVNNLQFFYYSALISVGFAISENFFYLINYGSSIIFARSITATIAHFTFGIMMSYFLTLYKIHNKKRHLLYAILIPTVAHGIYDLNLFLDQENSLILLIIILQVSLVVCSNMIKNIKEFIN